jgi:pimeloyl-ACP methyl ester carboxylesterase
MSNSAWVDMLGGEITYFNAGGIRTRCLHAGSGEPLILLHGMGGHAEAYLKNIMPIASRFHVYAIDMVGHGFTDKPAIGYAVPDFVNHVANFIDAIGAGKVHLQGESLGGWVAALMGIDHPEKVRSVILNTNAGLQLTEKPPEVEANAVERLRNLTKEAAAVPTRESVQRRLDWLFLNPKKSVTEELVEIRYRIYSQPETQKVMPTIIENMTGPSRQPYMLTRERLSKIKAPTMIVWTRHNPTTPWQVGQMAHEIIKGSTFHVMEDCGHWPQWEQPEEFNKHMLDFLSGLES